MNLAGAKRQGSTGRNFVRIEWFWEKRIEKEPEGGVLKAGMGQCLWALRGARMRLHKFWES